MNRAEPNQQLIRDGEEAEEQEDDRGVMQHEDMNAMNFEGRGGALVQEAKALLQQDEDEAPKEVTNKGPTIKMNKIRKKNANRPGAAAKAAEEKTAAKTAGASDPYKSVDKPAGGQGGFTEQDIEFMKKAI